MVWTPAVRPLAKVVDDLPHPTPALLRVLAGLRDKPADALRIGLGHDMRLPAAGLAARYALRAN